MSNSQWLPEPIRMSQPAHAFFKDLPHQRSERLVGECRLAAQAIRPISGSAESKKYPWLEFLIRPCGSYAGIRPIDYVHLIYDSPIGLGLDDIVCTMVLDWLKRQSIPYRASINIHPASLARREFAEMLVSELQAAGIAGERICLELVEFTKMVPIDQAMDTIEMLKAAGIKLAIDDYGRGMPCFEFYGAGVIDYIKVDRAYVKDICSHPGHASLLKGIVSMARELHAEVVAEGVEYEEQRELLARLGVPWAQGYLFERPKLIEI